jgi:hypothetical protein
MHPRIIRQIKSMHESGLGYTKISKELNIPKTTVRYNLDPNGKEKVRKKVAKWRGNNPLENKLNAARNTIRDKIKSFKRAKSGGTKRATKANVDSKYFLEKIIANPVCYLTGMSIDLTRPRSYQLDHKIPVSRGGISEVSNFGLCCDWVNRAKCNMTVDEFITMCKLVVKHADSTNLSPASRESLPGLLAMSRVPPRKPALKYVVVRSYGAAFVVYDINKTRATGHDFVFAGQAHKCTTGAG